MPYNDLAKAIIEIEILKIATSFNPTNLPIIKESNS
jgi:hypothetical protein